ncbi:hypothetical protein SDRG_00646 [Saprolegnia diclina VS20]|uniref:Potassium channel tetramerisation-type BTB domain-containing protein n=1 Tax=Saprolegnia diclina (strain VS20) TaxID=1156394 RepID=T0S8Z7_SAPDV|nr:hypothetical protein SDRG_00646 [Saprolegnia diclina VS20]EQC41783.1 hypothetical protein SDRG_00646 [Saprolegnia diclina VS20]|eukprot:XP_008604352.1 hypothetical protein SDRG_00646 [Saprolegnia diclina VS20]
MVDGRTNLAARIAALRATPRSDAAVDEMDAIVDALTAKEEALRQQETHVAAQLELLQRLHTPRRRPTDLDQATELVTLNVGGTLFRAARKTLCRVLGSYFDACRAVRTLPLHGLDEADVSDLRAMLDYLQLDVLQPSTPSPPTPAVLRWDPQHSANSSLFLDNMTLASHVGRQAGIVIASQPIATFAVCVKLCSTIDIGFTLWDPS